MIVKKTEQGARHEAAAIAARWHFEQAKKRAIALKDDTNRNERPNKMIVSRLFPTTSEAKLHLRVLRARRVDCWLERGGLQVAWVKP